MIPSLIRPRTPLLVLLPVLLFTLGWGGAGRADIILFTASADASGGYGYPPSYSGAQGTPGDTADGGSNANIPTISPGVSINAASANPGYAYLDDDAYTTLTTGPNAGLYYLGNTQYGPFGYGGNAGGSTQVLIGGSPAFDTVSYTFTASTAGQYEIVFEVAAVGGPSAPALGSALAMDTATLTFAEGGSETLYSFGSGIPGGFTEAPGGTTFNTALPSTSGLSPQSNGQFGYIDTSNASSTVTPLYDTVDMTQGVSRVYSAAFTANPGDTLTLDVAFLTNDGGNFADYGIVALTAVPEPAGLVGVGSGLTAAAVYLGLKHHGRRRAAAGG